MTMVHRLDRAAVFWAKKLQLNYVVLKFAVGSVPDRLMMLFLGRG